MMLQSFNWVSWKQDNHLRDVQAKVGRMKRLGVQKIWIPPCASSFHPEGYKPRDYMCLNSEYGSSWDLIELNSRLSEHGIDPIMDLVCWYTFGDMVRDDGFRFGKYVSRPDDQDFMDIFKGYVFYLQQDFCFSGVRFDFVKSWPCNEIGISISSSFPDVFCVGELWDNMEYDNGYLLPDQTHHRDQICSYIDSSLGNMHMFDFTTKGILQSALSNNEYWRLGPIPGVMGKNPERAITFVDNHDTKGQNHWPCHFTWEAYTYIMTHPSMPCIYWDHFLDDDMYPKLCELSDIRQECNISPSTDVVVLMSTEKRYVAKVGKLTVCIGEPCHWLHPAFEWGRSYIYF